MRSLLNYLLLLSVLALLSLIIYFYFTTEDSKVVETHEEIEFTPINIYMKRYKRAFAGVYIFKNTNKNIYYVGQSVQVNKRLRDHVRGRGNPELYRDYKRGHPFEVNVIPCHKSDLNRVERKYIRKYNSYYQGYNKTRGNS